MGGMLGNRVIILALLAVVKSARILVVSPIPASSHHAVFCALIQELVKRNHEVTAITTDRVFPEDLSPDNLTEINLKDMSYAIAFDVAKNVSKSDESNFSKIKQSMRSIVNLFLKQLKEESVRKIFEDKKKSFDLLIVEACVPGVLILSHVFQAPLILLSTAGAYVGNMEIIGSEVHPLLFPVLFRQRIYNLTILEKIWELYIEVAYNVDDNKVKLDWDRELKAFLGKDTPPLDELKNNVHLLLLNVHPIWVHNQAVPPNVAYIWGIHKPSEKVLPEELLSYMDSSKHGVIYVSFGSVFKTSEIPPETVKAFVEVFSRLPYNILWKWDADELPGKSDNIKISKWFPQNSILKHPNLKLFITHGGLQSTDEAINAGVPLIGIPHFWDQHYNTEKYVYFKIGIQLDYKSITTEVLESAINTILTDYNSYKANIAKLRAVMQQAQAPALQRAIWRVEHALRHGGARHLRSPAAGLSWAQYYALDAALPLLAALLLLAALAALALHALYARLLTLARSLTNRVGQPTDCAKYK